MSAILFLPYNSDLKYNDRRKGTISWLGKNITELRSKSINIVECDCSDSGESIKSDYEDIFTELWGKDSLLICEHDIVPTLSMIERLLTCKHDLCAQDYFHIRVKNQNGQMIGKSISKNFIFDGDFELGVEYLAVEIDGVEYPLCNSDSFADMVGFGLTKFSLDFQLQHPLEHKPGPWYSLDSRVDRWIHGLGYRWHVHRPMVKHNHWVED